MSVVHRVLFTISYLYIFIQLLQYALPPVEIPCLLPNFLSIDISQCVLILVLCSLPIYLYFIDSSTFDCTGNSWIYRVPRTHICNMRNQMRSSFFPFFSTYRHTERLYYLLIIKMSVNTVMLAYSKNNS